MGWRMSVIQRVNSGIEQMMCSFMQGQQAASGYRLFYRDESLPRGVLADSKYFMPVLDQKVAMEGWLEEVLSAWYFPR